MGTRLPPSQPPAAVANCSADAAAAMASRRAQNPPRLNVGVFSKHKGVRYRADGRVRACRFCEILGGRDEEFLFEDEQVVVFRPLRPVAPSHVLIVPRAHLRNVNQLARRHRALLRRMKAVADAVVAKHFARPPVRVRADGDQDGDQDGDEDQDGAPPVVRVRSSFHLPPFNSIDHVHMHAFLDDPAALGVYGRLKYRTESWWCRSTDEVLSRLDELAATRAAHEDEDDQYDQYDQYDRDQYDDQYDDGYGSGSPGPERDRLTA